MKLVGLPYLHYILKPIIEQVLTLTPQNTQKSTIYLQVLQVYCIVMQGHWPKIHKYMIRKIQSVKSILCPLQNKSI